MGATAGSGGGSEKQLERDRPTTAANATPTVRLPRADPTPKRADANTERTPTATLTNLRKTGPRHRGSVAAGRVIGLRYAPWLPAHEPQPSRGRRRARRCVDKSIRSHRAPRLGRRASGQCLGSYLPCSRGRGRSWPTGGCSRSSATSCPSPSGHLASSVRARSRPCRRCRSRVRPGTDRGDRCTSCPSDRGGSSEPHSTPFWPRRWWPAT